MNNKKEVTEPTRPLEQFLRATVVEGHKRCDAYFTKAVALRIHDTVANMEVIVCAPNTKALDYFWSQWQRLQGKQFKERTLFLNPKHIADVAIINQSNVKMEDDEL